MRTHASVQPLATSLKWMENKRATHLSLIVDIKGGSADYGKCIKLGSLSTCEAYMRDNKEAGDEWTMMSYESAKHFANETATGSTADTVCTDESGIIDTTDSDVTVVVDRVKPKQAVERTYGENRSIAGANAIAELIQQAINGALDVGQLKVMAEQRINEAVRDLVSPQIISVKPSEDGPAIPVGLVHKNFPDLLMACNARGKDGNRLNILLVGPAGTGKTNAAKQAAKALGLSFYPLSPIDSKFELFGFIDAMGKVVRTAFRECWEHGGVFSFDEMSASSEQAIMAFNGCLSSGLAPFPDGAIQRHPDCVIVGGDNVFGAPTASYNARNKMDDSSMDRWIPIDWEIDTVLERGITQNDSWVNLVQAVRQAVIDKGIKVLITPRSSVYGEALLRAGMDRKTVARLTMKKNMTNDQWALIERTVGL